MYMNNSNLSICIIGATGATGQAILDALTSNPDTRNFHIVTVTRHPLNLNNSTIKQIILDDFDHMYKLETLLDENIDTAICALGTTRAKAGVQGFIRVDRDYVLNFGQIMKEKKQCKEFHLISASNAHQDSYFLYPQIKGQTEEDLKKLNFDRLYIYRPSLLLTSRNEFRFVETIAQKLSKFFDYQQRMSIPVSTLASTVVHFMKKHKIQQTTEPTTQIITHSECIKLGSTSSILNL